MHRRSASRSAAPAAYRPPFDLAGVAPHLETYKDFDITGVASGLRGGDTTLLQGRRKLRPFLLQLVTGAFLVSQTLPERRIQTQAVAHLRGRTTGGLDVEIGDLVGNSKQ
jgi:hypothetical protein